MSMGTYNGHTAIGAILEFIVEREEGRIQQQINRLSAKNATEAGHSQCDGFLFKGTFYQDTSANTYYREKHVLIPSLWGEMDAVLRDRQRIRSEDQKTRQGLLLLLKGCSSWQDARDALPEFLVPALKLEPALPRTRDEGWTVEDNPARKAAYLSVRDTLEIRTASRLIF